MFQTLSKIHSIFLVIFTFLILVLHLSNASASTLDVTRANVDSRKEMTTSQKNRAEEIEKKILCAFETKGLMRGTTRQRGRARVARPPQMTRALYIARHWANLVVRLYPDLGDTGVRHMMAQMLSETGNLKFLTELRSEYASSRKKHKGRGTCQTTHRSNYAQLASCSSQIANSAPGKISLVEIARTPRDFRSELVRNPAQAMSERTATGQFYNAMSCPCYFLNGAARHRNFNKYLSCATLKCIDQVGVGVNRGFGAVDRKSAPLNRYGRRKAFMDIGKCFGTSRSRRNSIDVGV